MYVLKPGLIKTSTYSGQGQLLLTEASLFAFRSDARATQVGGAVGGLFGALIGHLIDSQKAGRRKSEDLDDVEMQTLPPAVLKSLRCCTLLVKTPLAVLSVKRTILGFTFEAAGATPVKYSGLIHKKSLRRFLEEHGVAIING